MSDIGQIISKTRDFVPKMERWIPAALGLIMCGGFFAIIAVMLFHPIPSGNESAVLLLLGAISGSVTTIVAFYFGSSKSSQTKDETIQKIAGGP